MGTFVDTVSNGPSQVCPYNDQHIIPSKKFTAHIMECSKNYQKDNFATCPYYYKHRMAKCEVYNHLNLCEFMQVGVITKAQMTEYARWAGIELKPDLKTN